MPMRIGVDTGGTFTDVVADDGSGTLRFLKIPSTSRDPAEAVLDGVRALSPGEAGPGGASGEGSGTVEVEVIHGTTVATNALLERRGGPTALVATRGFEDVLALRRQARPNLYALHPVIPPPLIPDALRFGVDERMAFDGSVIREVNADSLREVVAQMTESIARGEVRSIAVALLHSYANDRHERIVGDALAKLGVPVSLSSSVLPEHREYERTSTTAIDAYVAPVLAPYLARLQASLGALRIMQSSGGAAAASEVARRPVRTILSGPAAGVVGARAACARAGITRFITFDMGGTSTDVSLVDGAPELTSEGEIDGHPVRVPSLLVHTVGAGGGSIAWRDEGGALKVGPRSAGAVPGPACYGNGGLLPTVTDAALVLGQLDPARFLGGGMRLDPDAAHRALAPLAASLGYDEARTAAGILQVATVVMARAIRVISVERGHDPRELALCAFGGAGGLFACRVAEELGVIRILIPPAPGLLCAYGALAADVTRDYTATRFAACPASHFARDLDTEFAPLEAAAHRDLDDERIPRDRRRLTRACDLRYAGQSYELSIDCGASGASDGGTETGPNSVPDSDLLAAFHAQHHRRYGFSDPRRPVERVALRVHARGIVASPPPLRVAFESGPAQVGDLRGVPVLVRPCLRPGVTVDGPSIVVEYSGTTVIGEGWRATTDEDGALHLARS